MAPGFIGVGAGKWTVPSPVPPPNDPEAYMPGRAGFLYVCMSGGTIEKRATPLGGHVRPFSFGFNYNVTLFEDGSPIKKHVSNDGGATWEAPVELTGLTGAGPVHAMGEDTLYRLNGSTIERSVDGAPWSAADAGAWVDFRVTSARLYVQAGSGTGPISSLAAAGGGATQLGPDSSGFVGRHPSGDDSVLIYNQDDPDHVSVRLGHSISVSDTDLLVEITSASLFFPFGRHHRDAKNLGGIAIVTADQPIPFDGTGWTGSVTGKLFRSTDNGHTFTEVFSALGMGLGEGGHVAPVVAYRGGPASGVWWAFGFTHDFGSIGDPEFHPSFVRSTDNGLTWAFVAGPDFGSDDDFDPEEWLYSAGVQPNRSG